MKSLIQQVREQVSELYQQVISHLKSPGLQCRVFDASKKLLFTLDSTNAEVVESSKSQIFITFSIPSNILEDFCNAHLNEPPYVITTLEYWDNDIFIKDSRLSEPIMLINSDVDLSFTYTFTSDYVKGE